MKFNDLYEALMGKLGTTVSKTVTPKNTQKDEYDFDLGREATADDNKQIDQAMSSYKGSTRDANAITRHLTSQGIKVKSVKKKVPTTTGTTNTKVSGTTGLQGNPVKKDQEQAGEITENKFLETYNKLMGEAWYDDIDDSDAYNEPDDPNYTPKKPKLIKQFDDGVTIELVELDDDEIKEKDNLQFIISAKGKIKYIVTYEKHGQGRSKVSVTTGDKKRVEHEELAKDFPHVVDYLKAEFV